MSAIQTGIELNDQFSGVLDSIISSVNLAVAAMFDMQQSMGADIDTSSIVGARDEINQAAAALEAMNQAAQQTASASIRPAVDGGNQEPISVPVEPVLPAPLVENPEPIRTEIQPNAPPDAQPVEIPVTWNTDSLEIFTGAGIGRFQQEVQSANSMLEQLSSTQDEIARQAYNTNLFPPEAFQNLNSLAVRIDLVRERIQAIEKNPVNIGTDHANAELELLRAQLAAAIQEQDSLNQAMQNMDVSAANDAYLRLSQTVGGTERYIRDNVDEQGRFNEEISAGTRQADDLMDTIKRAVGAYVSIQTVGKALDISDELVQTTSRLDMMNDGTQTTAELVNMVYAAAQDARGSFSQMADVVARFGNNAKDAFSSSEEVVAFADLIQKQMTIAGASTQEAANAELQLSQALGSGVLRGDELNSIFEQAPNLIQNIADYLSVPIGQIREMASEGELSADVVKAAVFSAADDINAKFESMPMTWGQLWQSMQNDALMAFQPVLQRLNDIANNTAFQTFVNGAVDAMAILANILLNILDLVVSIGTFMNDNWSFIAPIIYGIVGALTAYVIISTIVAFINGVVAIAAATHAAAEMIQAGATIAATAAQYGLNAALMACPLTWIVLLVIALIAGLLLLCNWIAKTTGAANSGIGIIVGALTVADAFIRNLFVSLINVLIDIGVVLWNFIASLVNFLANAFTNPVGAIARLVFDLVDCVLGLLQTVASAIDTIFGTGLGEAVQGWRDGLGGWVDDVFGQGKEVMARVNSEDLHIARVEYGEAWDKGAAIGDGIAAAIDDFSVTDLLGDMLGTTEIPNMEDYTPQFAGMGDNLETIAGDTGNISDALEITEEDLKYLRDLAEQEAVNKFTIAEINIDQSGMQNNITNGMDLDGVMSGMTDAVNEAIDSMTEGVHE